MRVHPREWFCHISMRMELFGSLSGTNWSFFFVIFINLQTGFLLPTIALWCLILIKLIQSFCYITDQTMTGLSSFKITYLWICIYMYYRESMNITVQVGRGLFLNLKVSWILGTAGLLHSLPQRTLHYLPLHNVNGVFIHHVLLLLKSSGSHHFIYTFYMYIIRYDVMFINFQFSFC